VNPKMGHVRVAFLPQFMDRGLGAGRLVLER
jgi:hypothetical protein